MARGSHVVWPYGGVGDVVHYVQVVCADQSRVTISKGSIGKHPNWGIQPPCDQAGPSIVPESWHVGGPSDREGTSDGGSPYNLHTPHASRATAGSVDYPMAAQLPRRG